MPLHNFDQIIDRCASRSLKWKTYDEDIIPMWVADMDFKAPEAVIEALQQRIGHGIFGYELPSMGFKETICERMLKLYQWRITPEHIVFLPGIVTGFNLACRAEAKPGDSVITQTPVYPPVLKAPPNQNLKLQTVELVYKKNRANQLHYDIDFEAFEEAIDPTTRLFILCHPQNPTGLEFTRGQLTRLAEICARHKVTICSDEIHCDLLLDDFHHLPLATLAPEIADNSITLMAPSKSYNIPGLGCSFAIIQNQHLRKRYKAAGDGIVPWVNALGLVAAEAAYRHGDEWLSELRKYLTTNRGFLMNYLQENLSQIYTTVPQATYLAWLDCRSAGIDGNPHEFFLKEAKVAFNDGNPFGPDGAGFVRLNFGCPQSRLAEALDRMRLALA
jgi:cystathionine beta-lyase